MALDTIADVARFLVGDTAGLRIDDPIVRAVTEDRLVDGYSSCADLPHTLRFLLGCRSRVNRREAGGHRFGARTMSWLCIQARVGKLGHPIARLPRNSTIFAPGDTIILDVAHSARTHTCVLLEQLPGELVTADYGQHPLRGQRPNHVACRVVRRPLEARRGYLWAGDRPIDSWLPLKAEIAWQRAEGTLAEPLDLGEWLRRHGIAPTPYDPELPEPTPLDPADIEG
jgi:hypothetical protein